MGKYYFASVILFCSMAMGSSQEERALALVGEATVKYTGVDENVSTYVEKQLDKTLTKEYRGYLGYMSWIYRTAYEKKVEVKWNF